MASEALFEAPIIVTGAAGFIGSNFVRRCNEVGQAVVSVDCLQYFGTRPELRGIDFGTTVPPDDLFSHWPQIDPTPGAIVHLGACTDTLELDLQKLNKQNLNYSKQIWELAVRERIPLVYASSAATYGDGSLGYEDTEENLHRLAPLNPYGDSKHQFDLWALERERAGVKPPHWSGFKFFNVYGFGERHKGSMASIFLHAFDQVTTKGKLRLFESENPNYEHGFQKRDFIFVGDCVDALWFALSKPIERGIFNLGTGKARTFLEAGRAVFAALGKPEHIEFFKMPETLAPRYQYFTEAKVARLRDIGFMQEFVSIEKGAERYMSQLASHQA